MKRIYNYILMSALAFVAGGCINEEFNNDIPTAESGDEVQFGLSLPDAKTRTVYGDEDTKSNVFPIYWVNEDKVQIFSPQCLEGRRSAEYKVAVDGSEQNYATSLTKTGAYGVQWGNEGTADFYSLYPSGNYTLSKYEDEDGNVLPCAAGITINYSQNILVDGDDVKSDMEDCLMYAKTTGVTRGETVNLHYDPISTVFMITLKVPDSSADDFTIQSISLISDEEHIAGTFSLDIADGSFAEWSDNSSSTVSAQIFDKNTGGYYTLVKGDDVTVPLFIAPVGDWDEETQSYTMDVTGWEIKVVANNKVYTKELSGQKVKAGKIHKITLPKLSTNKVEEWKAADWMINIPRNVYLSEISIPGTWNSLNGDCQNDKTISGQYALGVRAFHLDTRWQASRNGNIGLIYNPTITGLSVCDGSTSYSVAGQDGRVNGTAAQTFEACLGEVTSYVQDNEYMVVFCTFAQDSYSGNNCPSTWQKAISDICADNDAVYDASGLTSGTLVGDVLGKVIVIVNLDASVSESTLPENSKCLFTYVPMNLLETHYGQTTSHVDNLYYSSKDVSGISMYTSHAQISTTNTTAVNCGDRGYSHPLTSRDALVESIWNWSKSNYGTTNYAHDKWIYLGLGGYIMNSSSSNGSGYNTIENRYAPMIYNRIDEMGSNNIPYYPVGIILMNNKKGSNYTDSNNSDLGYKFSDVCMKILTLNNKYRLQYDPSKPSDYIGGDEGGSGEGGL